MPLLEVEDVRVHFRIREGLRGRVVLRAVDGVSLTLERGESVGLVGESGSGKTTLGSALLGLVPLDAGRVRFDGSDVSALSGAGLRRFREQAQMIFQDPMGSLNPRMPVGAAIAEILTVHGTVPRRARAARVRALLESVGLDGGYADRYPHEFSGGQRQRIGIARALAVEPALLIADEPVSALDVSVQVQILNLMKDLQKELGLAYLFIAHDLAVVRYVCDRVLVMYLGRIIESAATDRLFGRPSHPYTRALLSAVPDVAKGLRARREGTTRIVLEGDVPAPTAEIGGCAFHPRCPRAEPVCAQAPPPVVEVAPGHTSVCHFARDG
ncbi:MAG: ABC transporter ATP-binding protein [Kiritimatiellae bacterium]|nr:ABC transporter ATP-binding protein [Kiritimatiellia bacterium]